METMIVIPIIVIYFYGLWLVRKQERLRSSIIGLVIGVTLTVAFILINQMMMLSNTLFLVFLIETLIFLTVLRIGDRVSILVLLLLLCSIGLSVYINFKYEGFEIYLSYIIALTFLLAENNQVFIKKTYEQSATEYQNKILNKQVEEVQNIYLTMRSWRHDYHNHLQKLKAHLMMEQVHEANEYLNELEIDLDNVNQLVESGNLNLDAILNSKLSLALKNKIELDFKASVPNQLTISDIDLCVLIGNLIDNAVEACIKMNVQDIKFVRIYIGVFKKQLYISVTNSTNELIRKLDHEYITTKRGNHGHGLKRINNIVNKYAGFINRQNEPSVFVTEVLLPL